jgi:nucleotide-binding universal stress UspA family protein
LQNELGENMSYKTILVCLASTEAASQILPTACSIARTFGAHLIGTHTLEALVLYPGIAMHIGAPVFQAFNDRQKAEDEKLHAMFETVIGGEDIFGEWRSLPAMSPHASGQLIGLATRADLIVMAQPDREHERQDQHGMQRDLIMGSGRPTLIIPPNYTDRSTGKTITLAWNGTREAAAAVHGGMPFLGEADCVNVLTVQTGHRHSIDRSTEGHEISKLLARHEVKAEVVHVEQSKSSTGEQILHEAKISGSDLIVMGAYGHSRAHSFLFGDATDYILNQSDLPVLLSN